MTAGGRDGEVSNWPVMDTGTPELSRNRKLVVQHKRADGTVVLREIQGIQVMPRAVSAGGIVLAVGAKNRLECTLDALYEQGLLGDPDETRRAEWRWEAGLELRRLFEDAGLRARQSASWNPGGRDTGEMSDTQAEAHSAYNRAMRACGPCSNAVSALCCHFERTPDRLWMAAVRGLDILAEHFGIAQVGPNGRNRYQRRHVLRPVSES